VLSFAATATAGGLDLALQAADGAALAIHGNDRATKDENKIRLFVMNSE
jgi:hypothetical protein